MNVERMTELRRVAVEAPDDHHFLMNSFGAEIVDDAGNSCGTAHCLAGWADVDPWFQAQGFPDLYDTSVFRRLANFFDLDESDASALFGGDLDIISGGTVSELIRSQGGRPLYLYGDRAKRLVIENIDRVLAGERAIPYPMGDDEEEA